MTNGGDGYDSEHNPSKLLSVKEKKALHYKNEKWLQEQKRKQSEGWKEEKKAHASIVLKQRWEDPKFKKENTEKIREHHNTKEYKKKIGRISEINHRKHKRKIIENPREVLKRINRAFQMSSDLHPRVRKGLRNELFYCHRDICNNYSKINKYITRKLEIENCNIKKSYRYWSRRGWKDEEIKFLFKDLIMENIKKVTNDRTEINLLFYKLKDELFSSRKIRGLRKEKYK